MIFRCKKQRGDGKISLSIPELWVYVWSLKFTWVCHYSIHRGQNANFAGYAGREGKGWCSGLRIPHVPAILPHPGRFFPHKAPMVNYDSSFVHILCTVTCKEGVVLGGDGNCHTHKHKHSPLYYMYAFFIIASRRWSWKGYGNLFVFVLFDVQVSLKVLFFFFCTIDGELDICRCIEELFLAFVWNSRGLSGTFPTYLHFSPNMVLFFCGPPHYCSSDIWKACRHKQTHLSLSFSQELTIQSLCIPLLEWIRIIVCLGQLCYLSIHVFGNLKGVRVRTQVFLIFVSVQVKFYAPLTIVIGQLSNSTTTSIP